MYRQELAGTLHDAEKRNSVSKSIADFVFCLTHGSKGVGAHTFPNPIYFDCEEVTTVQGRSGFAYHIMFHGKRRSEKC